MARDCTVKPDLNGGGSPGSPQQAMTISKGGFDSEYASLMAELGESAGGGDGVKPSWGGGAGHDITAGGSNIPPWRRPEMWQQPQSNPQGQGQGAQGGYRPPQAYGAAGYGGGGGGAGGAGYGGSPWGQQPAQGGYQQQAYPQQDYSAAYAQYYQGQYNQTQTGTPTQ